MTTSGTTSFNSSVLEIIEDAYELIGSDFTTGYDAKIARRFFNLLLIDLQNRGHPLGKLELITQTLTSGTRTYTLNANIIDILHTTLKRGAVETEMRRVSLFEDNALPVKTQTGRPFQLTVDRDRDSPIIKIWPTPDNSTDVLQMYVVKKIEDITSSRETVDLSTRFQPALVFGLAYLMSYRRQDIDAQRRQELKQTYTELLEGAFEEDKERTSFFARPQINRPR